MIDFIYKLKYITNKKFVGYINEFESSFSKEIDYKDTKMRKIIVLYCGGTISSKPDKDGVRNASSIDLIEEYKKHHSYSPSFIDNIDIAETHTIYRGLSENITSEIEKDIIAKIRGAVGSKESIGVLLTFGTDAIVGMSRTVFRECHSDFQERGITLVITGANDDTTVVGSDAWDNLGLAFKTLAEDPKGVVVCFGDRVIPANRVERLPFNGKSMTLGDINEIDYWKDMCNSHTRKDEFLQSYLLEHGVALYYVNRVSINNHNEFLSQIRSKNTKVVIFVLYHSGTANTDGGESSVSELIKTLVTEYGIICFGASDNDEPVTLDSYSTGVTLREAGLIPLYNMTYSFALIKASLILVKNREEIISEMLRNFNGEIDESLINRKQIETLKRMYTWTK